MHVFSAVGLCCRERTIESIAGDHPDAHRTVIHSRQEQACAGSHGDGQTVPTLGLYQQCLLGFSRPSNKVSECRLLEGEA